MIGNDIVDLRCAKSESNWQRAGFLDKVFDDHEINVIRTSSNPNALVWRLWTMKESTYKANFRRSSKRFFNPKRISCTLLDHQRGSVTIDSYRYKTMTETNSNYIHTVALSDTISAIDSSCFSLKEASYSVQHRETYNELTEKLAADLGLTKSAIQIKKDPFGIPMVYVENQLLKRYITMTHHGHYAAIALTNHDI